MRRLAVAVGILTMVVSRGRVLLRLLMVAEIVPQKVIPKLKRFQIEDSEAAQGFSRLRTNSHPSFSSKVLGRPGDGGDPKMILKLSPLSS